jgi:hypothetical protein
MSRIAANFQEMIDDVLDLRRAGARILSFRQHLIEQMKCSFWVAA